MSARYAPDTPEDAPLRAEDPASVAPAPSRSAASPDVETPEHVAQYRITHEDRPSLEGRRADMAKVAEPDGAFWVFGYGSLMWRPGFKHIDQREAVVSGYARRFCLRSLRYRGTPEAPGLVLGLAKDPQAETRGMAFKVPADCAEETLAYLAEREMSTAAYFEVAAPVRFTCRPESPVRAASAIAYVCDPEHRQFAGALSLEEQAKIIARSSGGLGPNVDYLYSTVAHLREIGVNDPELESLMRIVRRLRREGDAPPPAAMPEDLDPIGD